MLNDHLLVLNQHLVRPLLLCALLAGAASLADKDFQIEWPAGTELTNTDTKKTSVIEPAPGEADPK